MSRPRCLDLFCGAGGAGAGYARTGFEVVGVDLSFQKHYPFEFHQADALTYPLEGFDLIHASPPCQFGSVLTPTAHKVKHQNLIPAIRARLIAAGVPYIIENVEGSRSHLINPIKLCGSMFGLGVWRHRYFECPWIAALTPPCNHSGVPVLISGTPRRLRDGAVTRQEFGVAECRVASGIDWMTRVELDQAIPPAYTEWLGRHVLAAMERAA